MNIAMAVLTSDVLIDRVNAPPVFPVDLLVAAFTGDGGRPVLAGGYAVPHP
jgi:hypothetical protein